MTNFHDPGWADGLSSCTWFDASVRRPEGPILRILEVCRNRGANPTFHRQDHGWYHCSSAQLQNWLLALREGDIVQLTPVACYLTWVNVVRETSSNLEYEPLDKGKASTELAIYSFRGQLL